MANGTNPIEHLVILMMENRSFDHYLGSLSLEGEGRADIEGLPNPLPAIPDENSPTPGLTPGTVAKPIADPIAASKRLEDGVVVAATGLVDPKAS